MSNRRPLIAGNWKMNGLTADGRALAADLAKRIKGVSRPPFDMVVCPPFTLIATVAAELGGTPIAVGGQDCHAAEKGAHTGDVSARMLADLGARYVILGHSERRTDHKETDAQVLAKAQAAHAAKVIALVCVGETEAQKDAGKTLDVVTAQLSGSVPKTATAADTVIAYEPVWAIGTGRTPTVAEVADVHAKIRAHLAGHVGKDAANGMRVLYGGSMKPSNAAELLAIRDVDGGLIGGASLKAEDFWSIAAAVPA